jgi:hypothetical protein
VSDTVICHLWREGPAIAPLRAPAYHPTVMFLAAAAETPLFGGVLRADPWMLALWAGIALLVLVAAGGAGLLARLGWHKLRRTRP